MQERLQLQHEARINFNGWVGEGYTLVDPNTGAGGYIISGGGNGGELPLLSGVGLGAAFFSVLALFVALTGPLAIVALLVGLAIVISVALYNLSIWSSEQSSCFWTGIGFGVGLAAFILAIPEMLASFAMLSSYQAVVVQGAEKLKIAIAAAIAGIFDMGSTSADSAPFQDCL